MCKDCGKGFETESKNKSFCDDCVKRRKRERWQRKNEENKKPKFSTKKLSIREVVKMLDKYNKKHNTNYSYGYFVYLLENEKINLKR